MLIDLRFPTCALSTRWRDLMHKNLTTGAKWECAFLEEGYANECNAMFNNTIIYIHLRYFEPVSASSKFLLCNFVGWPWQEISSHTCIFERVLASCTLLRKCRFSMDREAGKIENEEIDMESKWTSPRAQSILVPSLMLWSLWSFNHCKPKKFVMGFSTVKAQTGESNCWPKFLSC